MKSVQVIATFLLSGLLLPAHAQIMLSGNENKIDLASGTMRVLPAAPPDTLTILDFSEFPPEVGHLKDLPNTVIGPPSNIAITPDGSLALIANSIKLDASSETGYSPESYVHILDLKTKPPRVIGEVQTGRQPSGMSITPNGRLAIVANRADGTVSVLRIDGQNVSLIQTVEVSLPEESASDVAISPDGKLALVSVQKGSHLRVLQIDGEKVTATARKISVYGQPYRVVITPDTEVALTAGAGFGNGQDMDALSVVDLQSDPIRTVDHIAIGSGPESVEVSPDGKLVAAVLMNGSNLAPDDPALTQAGGLVILSRKGTRLKVEQRLETGRIPEGVAFTSDGRYLVVQENPTSQLWIYRVRDKTVRDSGVRIEVPGMPSSLRAAP
jgi:DNA-binding beta-propeller fold protein YncE